MKQIKRQKATSRKTRKLSLLVKQLGLIMVVVWLAIGLTVSFTKNAREKDYLEIIGTDLVGLATLLDTYIDTDKVHKIAEAGGECEAYYELQTQLTNAKNSDY